MRRWWTWLAVGCMMLTVTAAPATGQETSPGATPGADVSSERWISQPGRVIRTISFRTVQAWASDACTEQMELEGLCYFHERAGRYIAIKDPSAQLLDWGATMYTARGSSLVPRDAADPLNVEFGVFAAGNGLVKLLGPNGLWVTLVDDAGLQIARASGTSWGTAVPLKVVSVPRDELDVAVSDYLTSGPDPSPLDGLVCVAAYDGSGGQIGYLSAQPSAWQLSQDAPCGSFADLLFNTDLQPGVSVTSAVEPSLRDPLLDARFVPPDQPRRSLTRRQITVVTGQVETYFEKAYQDLAQVGSVASKRFDAVMNEVMPAWYEGPEAESDTTSALLGATSGAIGLIGALVPPAKAGQSIITLVELGMTLAEQPNRYEPRLMASVRNNLLRTNSELQDDLLTEISVAMDRTMKLMDRIIAGCDAGGTRCRSHRALRVWLMDPPRYPSATRQDVQNLNVAGLERDAWLRMLPTTGVLFADQYEAVGGADREACDVGMNEQRSPDDLLGWLNGKDLMLSPFGDDTPLVTSPYLYAAFACSQHHHLVWFSYVNDYIDRYLLVRVAILSQDPDGWPTPLANRAVNRLFGRYDPERPFVSGLEIPRRDVACVLPRVFPPATYSTTDLPFPRTTFLGCDLDYTTATGVRVDSPRYGSPENIGGNWGGDEITARLKYKPGGFAVWIPDQSGAVRDINDYDVVPAQEPRAIWGACDARAELRSTPGGLATTVYFLNVTGSVAGPGEDVVVRRLDVDGAVTGDPIIIPADGPLLANTDTYEPVGVAAHVGEAFLVKPAVGCLGTWTASAGDYSVAEVHSVP